MKHRILSTNNYLTIEYDLIDDWIKAIWESSQTDQSIRLGYEMVLDFLSQHHCGKLLDDHTNFTGIWSETASWIAKDWHPRARQAGLQFHAFVYARDFFSRKSTEQTISHISHSIVTGFEDVETAKSWLKAMQ